MEFKDTFFASLSDSQLGFFRAREYDENLSDLLQDELNVHQYQLYEKWKENEKTISVEDVQQSPALKDLSDKMSRMMKMLETLSARMDSMETKMENKLNLMEHTFADKIERVEKSVTDSEDAILKKVEDTVQSVDLFKHEEWMLLKEKVDDITNNTCMIDITSMNEQSALKWLQETRNSVFEYKKEYIRPSLVNRVIAIMKKFEDNEKVQTDGCWLLFNMTECSDSTVHCISNNMGTIEHLMKIAQRDQGKGWHGVFHVLPRIAECNETRQKLMKYEYLKMFLNALASTTKVSAVGFLSSLILANLLDLPETEFPQELKKEDIENKLAAIYEEILTKRPVNIWNLTSHFSWYLDRIITGTKAQKYVCAYVIRSFTHIYIIKIYLEAGVIPVLEKVIADPVTDSIVKKLAAEALNKFKK